MKVCSLQYCLQEKKMENNPYVLSEREWIMEGILYSREMNEWTKCTMKDTS